MSTRLTITGFDFATMQALGGKVKWQELLTDRAAADQTLVSIVERFAAQGMPFSDLDKETFSHVTAAEILCRHGQEHLQTGIEGWKLAAVKELNQKLTGSKGQNKTAVTVQQLIDCLTVGRPLFGKSIDASPAYYGYLRLAEIKQIRKILRPYKPREKQLPFDPEYEQRLIACGFEKEVTNLKFDSQQGEQDIGELDDLETALSRWLYEIEKAGLDLWISVN